MSACFLESSHAQLFYWVGGGLHDECHFLFGKDGQECIKAYGANGLYYTY